MIKIIGRPIKTEFQVPEPLSLDEVKEQLNIMDDDNNNKLEKLIPRCRLIIEDYCNISIVAKRIELVVQVEGRWLIPYGPVTGIEAVQSRENTIGSGMPNYTTLETGWMVECDYFCTTSCRTLKLIYTAGMSEVPENLKLAILNEVAYRYRNVGDETKPNNQISEESKTLADKFWVPWL